jgi:hypothetical protein
LSRLSEDSFGGVNTVELIICGIYVRSGSTLLQRICNARAETLIWGEHGTIVSHFLELRKHIMHFSDFGQSELTEYIGSGENPNTWIGSMTPSKEYVERAVVESLRACLETLYEQYREGHDIIGFKEVRYGKREIELLRCGYPRASFFLLVRNPLDIWRSVQGWDNWELPLADLAESWNSRAAAYVQLSQADPAMHLIKHEDVVSKKPDTVELLTKVAKLSEEDITGVLTHKLGSNPRLELSEADRQFVRSSCEKMMRRLGYLPQHS